MTLLNLLLWHTLDICDYLRLILPEAILKENIHKCGFSAIILPPYQQKMINRFVLGIKKSFSNDI